MQLQPDKHWRHIRALVLRAFPSSLHFAFGTVNADGTPHVSPIGSLVLKRNEPKGLYFEAFTARVPQNLENNPRVCILAVNSSRWFWYKALFRGRFSDPPAVRLIGTAGERRKATPREIELWRKRVRRVRWLRGFHLLWGQFEFVREIEFDAFEPVQLGVMTQGHWSGDD